MSGRFATLTFGREVPAPVSVLGGREVSLCKVEGQPVIRCEGGWLELQPAVRSVNHEVISSEGAMQSVALVTADFSDSGEGSRVVVTV